MSNTRMKLEVLLAGVDRLSRPLRDAMAGSKELAQAVKHSREQMKALERTQSNISGYKKQTAALQDTRAKLDQAQQRVRAMRDQMRAGEEQTAKFRKAFTKANESVRDLNTQVQRQTRDLAPLRAKLSEAGVKVAQLGSAETSLKGKIDGTNEALKRQREQLEKVSRHQQRLNDIRGRYGRAKEVRDNVAGAGMSTMAAGAVTAAPMVKTVADYARFEDAMLGVAKQVDGARDDNGRLTATYFEMGDAIKAMGERIPMATTEIAALVEGGARMGIQGKDNLLIFAETAAKAATAFDMPADQLSEDMGKIANIYKIPIKNIEQLGDVINYLDDNAQSKGGDIINVMQRIAGNVGSMDYKQAAALASTFLSLGSGPEVAATATKAMVRELQIASKQPARFRKGLKELGLDAKQLERQMARDSTGTIMKVLEAVKKLPDTKRMGVMVDLFGKEYGDDAAKLADNLGEYRKQLELVNSVKAKGSMQREADAKKDTLSAQWQMTRNRLFNQSSALGATLKPALVEIMSAAAKVLERFSAWTKANPQLVATLMKIAAVVAVVLTALGGLLLMVAATLGPLALARMSVSTLFAGLGSGAGILGRIGKAIGSVGKVLMWIGRLALANPLLAVIAIIAMAAIYIWRNWDTLGPKFAKLWASVKQFFSDSWNWICMKLAEFVVLYILPVIDKIKEKFKAGWEFVKTSANDLLTWFQNLPSRFVEFGSNIMQGLVSGIKSGLVWVKDAILGVGDMLPEWLRNKLDIHSPSRVFAGIGGYTMAGLEQGIVKNQNGPLAALRSATGKLTALGTGVMLGAGPALAGQLDTRPPLARPAAAAAAPVMINAPITIHAAPGMDERALARLVRQELEKAQRDAQARQRSKFGDID